MSMDDSRPVRGRPPGPNLSAQAVSILERNAFSAMRGPNSRGAVPRSAFGEIDVSTVDRSVKRAFGGQSGRTPFDMASHQICSIDGPTRSTLQSVFRAVAQSFRDTDEMEITLRVFLRANFIEACDEEGLLATVIVTAAACAHLSSEREAKEAGQSAAAREVVAMRQKSYSEMTEGFVAGLSIAMRRLHRRPKAAYSLKEVVTALIACTDGFLLLYKLQPDLVDVELVVETQWGIIWNLSEPGLLDPPNRSDSPERYLVEAALAVYRTNALPSVEALAKEAGLTAKEAKELFPNDESLAQRCMDYAVGSSVETEGIAVNVRGAELAAVRDVLIATTQQATATPLLIEVLRRTQDGGFCDELCRHIAEALGQSESMSLDYATAEVVAQMLVNAALQGSAGQPVWETGLDAFASKE